MLRLGRQQGHPDNSGLGRVVPALFGSNSCGVNGLRRLPGQPPSDCRARSPERLCCLWSRSTSHSSIMESLTAAAGAVPDDRCRPPPQASGALLDESEAAAEPVPCGYCGAFTAARPATAPRAP